MIDGSLNNNNDELDVANEDDSNQKFAMDTRQDNIEDIHDHVNYNTSTDMIKNTCLKKELNLPDIRTGPNETSSKNTQLDSLTDINCTMMSQEKLISEPIMDFYSEQLCCDLDTYLKKFETLTDIKTLQNPSLIEDATRNCPTPDILIKNDKKSCRKKSLQTLASSENRPDLLRNVSPNSDSDCSTMQNGQKKLRISVPDNIQLEVKGQSPEKQDELNSYSITPVDIVGDFGREVEHEFGLIVSGYNSIGRFCDAESVGQEISKSLEKMTDATLTDCKEEISVCSEMSLSARSLIHATATSDCTTCDLVKASTPATSQPADEAHTQQNLEDADRACKQSIAIVVESVPNSTSYSDVSASSTSSKSIESRNSDQQRAEHLAQPAKLTNENSNVNIICNGAIDTTTKPTPTVSAITSESGTQQAGMLQASANLINSSITAETDISVRLIPTAIVKPKYQKSSYDERQLPPIGLAYCSDQPTSRFTASHKSSKDTQHSGTGQISSGGSVVQTSDSRSRKIHHHHLPVQSVRDSDRLVKYSKKSIGRTFQSVISRSGYNRKDISSTGSCVAIVTPRKKDKMENYTSFGSGIGEKRVISGSAVYEKNNNNSGLSKCNKANNNRKERSANVASFDVYNIETALPVIDLEAIENHLKKAKEEERKRRNDREEIRRRLAMGAEDDYFSKIVNQDRPGRKPSLQSRLQGGMNLQICFMNEASSDTESPSSDSETCPKLSKSISNSSNMSRFSSASSAHNPYHSRPLSVNIINNNNNTITNNSQTHANNQKFNNQMNRPSTLSLGPPVTDEDVDADFFTKQARLQIEARMALAQAKDMAHMQMEIERQKQKSSPITEVIRNSMEKVGVPFPPEKRRVSRQMLTDMNIAQLQIIVNDLHSQIERLNEQLVQYLMERDDLHMGQDSMLVDIEDLTRYLGAKEQTKLNKKSSVSSYDFTNQNQQVTPINNSTTQNGGVQFQNKFLRIANLVKK